MTDKAINEVKDQVIDRDDGECQDCGAPVATRSRLGVKEAHVHHRTPKAEGGTDDPENLVTLCRDCHNDRHGDTGVGGPTGGRSGAKTRALLTETEREQIAGDHGRDRKYQATSRVRARIEEELTQDVAVLEDHHPDLLEELRDVVCEEADDAE